MSVSRERIRFFSRLRFYLIPTEPGRSKVPAEKIGDFESVRLKRREESILTNKMSRSERLEYEWMKFYEQRESMNIQS